MVSEILRHEHGGKVGEGEKGACYKSIVLFCTTRLMHVQLSLVSGELVALFLSDSGTRGDQSQETQPSNAWRRQLRQVT
jgi:hypothetical protein